MVQRERTQAVKIEQAVYLTIVTVGLREQSIHMTTRVDLQNLQRVQNIAAKMGKKCEESSLACLKKTALGTNNTRDKILKF